MTGKAWRVAAATGLSVALASCGGLGVNVRSGNANNPNQVAITPTSGTALNPYPIELGHTTVMVAHPSAGNVVNYAVVTPVAWNSSNPASVRLFEGDCVTAYGGEGTTSICLGASAPGGATINATTTNGAVGSINITVTI